MTVSAEIDDLIDRVARQDRRAFARLYDATSAQLFGVICAILPDRNDAQKALQDTYVRIWRSAGRYADSGLGPETFLIEIARNFAVDQLQRSEGAVLVHDDLLQQIYWRGDKYDALAQLSATTADAVRGQVATDLAVLQGRLAP